MNIAIGWSNFHICCLGKDQKFKIQKYMYFDVALFEKYVSLFRYVQLAYICALFRYVQLASIYKSLDIGVF